MFFKPKPEELDNPFDLEALKVTEII